MEKNLTEQQSLKIIHEMIATSKNNLKDNSFFYLLWGWLVLAASLSHFVLLYYVHWEYAFLPWPVLMILGAVVSTIAGYRLGKKSRVMSHVDKMMVYLWYGFLVVITLVIVMALVQKLAWTSAYPVIISLYGLGTFVSGGVLKFRPLIIGGVACWGIAVATIFLPVSYLLLMVALSVIVAYLIPGYLLKSKE